jgi:hypothetical protein
MHYRMKWDLVGGRARVNIFQNIYLEIYYVWSAQLCSSMDVYTMVHSAVLFSSYS